MWGGLPPTCDMEEPLSALLALPVSPLPCICPSPAFPSPLLPLACPPPALRSSSLKGRGHFPELSSSPTGPSTQFLEASQSLVLGIHNPTWVEVGTGFSQSPAESWRAWCQAASAGGSSGPPENTTDIIYRGWTCTDHTCSGYLKACPHSQQHESLETTQMSDNG